LEFASRASIWRALHRKAQRFAGYVVFCRLFTSAKWFLTACAQETQEQIPNNRVQRLLRRSGRFGLTSRCIAQNPGTERLAFEQTANDACDLHLKLLARLLLGSGICLTGN
jgi:hypothetical protein